MCKSQFPFKIKNAKTMLILFTWLWMEFIFYEIFVNLISKKIPFYYLPPQYLGEKKVIFLLKKNTNVDMLEGHVP